MMIIKSNQGITICLSQLCHALSSSPNLIINPKLFDLIACLATIDGTGRYKAEDYISISLHSVKHGEIQIF